MFQIFIGYALAFFSLKIGGFDILPDFIGYFLIFRGLVNNLNRSYKFSFAKPLSLVLSVWSLINTVIFLFANKLTSYQILLKADNLLYCIASVVLIYLIVLGYKDIEKNEKINLKLTVPFIFLSINAATGILANIVAFFSITNVLENVFAAIAIINTIAGFIFVVYLYVIYRNYNIEIYNKTHKKEEFWNSSKQDK